MEEIVLINHRGYDDLNIVYIPNFSQFWFEGVIKFPIFSKLKKRPNYHRGGKGRIKKIVDFSTCGDFFSFDGYSYMVVLCHTNI